MHDCIPNTHKVERGRIVESEANLGEFDPMSLREITDRWVHRRVWRDGREGRNAVIKKEHFAFTRDLGSVQFPECKCWLRSHQVCMQGPCTHAGKTPQSKYIFKETKL